MTKMNLGLCAGACLLLAAGCASSDIMAVFSAGGGNERVVVGSLDEVAKSTQATLQRLDLRAELTQQGESIHIASALQSGARFKLVLTRDRSSGEEKTRVRMEWVDPGVEHMTVEILGRLDKAR
ncbi:MAG TPA: hypothetical protein VEL76_22215 [Gemmataceae bacterium]|nr:hypothetical protein [Gemmataceae bacterium]